MQISDFVPLVEVRIFDGFFFGILILAALFWQLQHSAAFLLPKAHKQPLRFIQRSRSNHRFLFLLLSIRKIRRLTKHITTVLLFFCLNCGLYLLFVLLLLLQSFPFLDQYLICRVLLLQLDPVPFLLFGQFQQPVILAGRVVHVVVFAVSKRRPTCV